MEQKKYDVFISYSRKDYVDEKRNIIPDNVVSKIKDALTEAGISFWFDEEGINHGDEFAKLIIRNIKASHIFIFISTENSNASEWTGREIASAHMMKKHIIPVRVDDSSYNEDVMFYLSILDFIDYKINPEKGLKDLIKAVKTELERYEAEKKRKEEEANKRKELERKREEEKKLLQEQEQQRREMEQKKLIADIKLSCKTLDNEEAKLKLDRENLLLKVEHVSDKDEQNKLRELVNGSSVNSFKYQKEYNAVIKERDKLLEEQNELVTERDNLIKERNKLYDERNKLSASSKQWMEKYSKLQSDLYSANAKITALEASLRYQGNKKTPPPPPQKKWYQTDKFVITLVVVLSLIPLFVIFSNRGSSIDDEDSFKYGADTLAVDTAYVDTLAIDTAAAD